MLSLRIRLTLQILTIFFSCTVLEARILHSQSATEAVLLKDGDVPLEFYRTASLPSSGRPANDVENISILSITVTVNTLFSVCGLYFCKLRFG